MTNLTLYRILVCTLATFFLSCTASFAASSGNQKPVLIIGAGISGLSAAKTLLDHHLPVLVLEARDRIGGRIHTQYQNGTGLDLGAAWIHGIDNNPIWMLAQQEKIETIAVAYDDNALSHKLKSWVIYEGHRRVGVQQLKDLQQLLDEFEVFTSDQQGHHAHDSIHDAMRQFMDMHNIQGDFKRLFQYIIHNVYVYEYGVDLEDLSWQCNLPYMKSLVGGDNVLFPAGYSQILKALSKNIPIKLNEVVKSIHYNSAGVTVVTNHHQYQSDYVIVTVPLGVLQSGVIQFKPSLPLEKIHAMQQLKMSLYNKIF